MKKIREKIVEFLKEEVKNEEIELEVPPKEEMGDLAFPCFTLAKEWKESPAEISKKLESRLQDNLPDGITAKSFGPYLNFFIESHVIAGDVVNDIQKQRECYGSNEMSDEVVLIESPGPNTNKPLHLGHLRNMLLGQSFNKVMRFKGKDAKIVNVINDRGIHICQSLLAYKKWGEGKTPESEGMKPDHFVGKFYVMFAQEKEKNPSLEKEAEDLLMKWEEGDEETIKLWKKMNDWAEEGFKQTYDRLGFEIEKDYKESETYKHGKEIINKGYEEGIFEKDENGSIIINLEDKGLGNKVLLRPNGTAVYITQDVYMAKKRYEDFKFDRMIYVVGNEQEYHFKVLFEIFKALGWSFGDKCYHFSYGMVELPEGKMKSREGNVVDTDDVLDEMSKLAEKEVRKRYKEISEEEIKHRSEVIGKGALRFFFLKSDPTKDFVFSPEESLSFEGETGPYVQYAYARIRSIFRKVEEEPDFEKVDVNKLDTVNDKRVLMKLSEYPEIVDKVRQEFKPSTLCRYLFELASEFNRYYRDNPVLTSEKEVRDARLALLDCVSVVLKSGLGLLGVDVLEQM